MRITLDRVVVLMTFVIFTNFVGLLYPPPLLLEWTDISLVVITSRAFFLLCQRHITSIVFKGIFASFSYFIIFVLIIAFSMLFRSTGTLATGVKVGRMYFILLLAIIIYNDVASHGLNFWDRFIVSVGAIYCLIVLLYYIFPNMTQNLFVEFSYMDSENSWGSNSSRKVVKSNYGILFIHLAWVVRFVKINLNKSRIKLLDIILTISMLMQGWRAIVIAIIIVYFLWLVIMARKTFYQRHIKYVLIASLFAVPLNFTLNNAIFSKFTSAYDEISGKREGTLKYRLERAEQFALPKYLEKPLFGYGFISEKNKTRSIEKGQRSYDKTNLLYNFDFGYLTMLIMFGGLIFSMIILLWMNSMLRLVRLIRSKGERSVYSSLFWVFFGAILIANYSFGGLVSYTGLLPIAFALGLGQHEVINS